MKQSILFCLAIMLNISLACYASSCFMGGVNPQACLAQQEQMRMQQQMIQQQRNMQIQQQMYQQEQLRIQREQLEQQRQMMLLQRL